VYDWSSDVMNRKWDPVKAKKKIKNHPGELVCDILLNQEIFAGVGNIIKNEMLYRIKLHPLSRVGNIPTRKLNEMLKEAVSYSFDFLKWKKKYILRKMWQVNTKKECQRCKLPIVREYLGKTNRRT